VKLLDEKVVLVTGHRLDRWDQNVLGGLE